MFAKVKDRLDSATKAPTRPAGGTDRAMPSIIGPDMVVNGNLDTPGEIHIEGRIEGDVTCSKLNVGPSGRINGKVRAGSVRVHGFVDGAIDAEEVFLLSGSLVSGDIVQSSLEIAPGASFEGAVRRRNKQVPQLEAPAPVPVEAEEVPAAEAAPEATAGGAPRKAAKAAKAAAEATDAPAEEAAPADTPANDSAVTAEDGGDEADAEAKAEAAKADKEPAKEPAEVREKVAAAE